MYGLFGVTVMDWGSITVSAVDTVILFTVSVAVIVVVPYDIASTRPFELAMSLVTVATLTTVELHSMTDDHANTDPSVNVAVAVNSCLVPFAMLVLLEGVITIDDNLPPLLQLLTLSAAAASKAASKKCLRTFMI